MRPNLILQPIHNSSADIIKCFVNAKPLSGEQLHFLEWHQKELSNKLFDPVLDYYLDLHKKHPEKYQGNFLLPHEIMNYDDIQKLKHRIQSILEQHKHPVSIQFSLAQVNQFYEYTSNELILWHGNQYLTGAPFIPGGTPPVIYFQWGNLFGIVKYVVLTGEKAFKSNLLIYFEDRQERDLDECVAAYQQCFNNEILQQHKLLMQNKLDPERFQHYLIKQARPHL